MTDDTAVYFYYREGCHLCEEMAAGLFRNWPAVGERMQWRDVDSREAWRDRFGLWVPVLALGDRVLSEYVLDPEQLKAHFGPPANPV